MAHELTVRENGFVEMGYLEGVARWHGMGNELKQGATIEEWCEMSGLNWKAQRAMVRYAIERGVAPENYRTFGDSDDGQVVLFRSDTKAPLGIVSTGYNVVQPNDILEFWRDLTGAGGMELQTAGSLFGGRKLWALAKVGEAAIIDPRNIVRKNLLIATALDGTMATIAKYVDTIVVCNNTMNSARGEKNETIKINHRSQFDAAAVKKELGVESAQSEFERALIEMRKLAEKRMSATDMILNTCELIKPGYMELDAKGKQKVENSKAVQAIGRMAVERKSIGADMDGYDGTAWGWLNAATEYLDHAVKAKSADHRMDSAFFGNNAAVKERARDMAIAYAPTLSGLIANVNAIGRGGAPADVVNTKGDIY